MPIDLETVLSEADSLIRPDGTLEPGYEGLAAITLTEIVNAYREFTAGGGELVADRLAERHG